MTIPEFAWRGATALVADDDESARDLLCRVLESYEIEVVCTAADGREAVAAFSRHRPDIVCCDMHMPEMDGIAAISTMRRSGSDAVALLFTGLPTDAILKNALAADVDSVIPKPYDFESVAREIARASWRFHTDEKRRRFG